MSIDTDYIGRLGRLAFAAAAAVAVAAFAACADDEGIVDNGIRPSDCLIFSTDLRPCGSGASRSSAANLETEVEEWALQTAAGEEAATRGTLTTLPTGEAGVIGYTYETGETPATPFVPSGYHATQYIVPFSFDGDELYPYDPKRPIRWKMVTGDHLAIYVYAPVTVTDPEAPGDPYKVEQQNLTVDTNYPPALTYEVASEVKDQKDIIISMWRSPETESYKNKAIPLTFDHALTAIRFKVGFECTVKSVSIEGVYNSGTYRLLNDDPSDENAWGWERRAGGDGSDDLTTASYTVDFGSGKTFKKGDLVTDNGNTLILIPQTLPADAKIVLTCTDKTYTAAIGGKSWDRGKLITYTLYENKAPETIYFDLALANVMIDGKTKKYSGKVHKDGKDIDVTGTHTNGNHYYVYQSTDANRDEIWNGDVCTPPEYEEVKGPDGRPWRDYITNNPDVNAVINAWSSNAWNIKHNQKESPGNDVLAQEVGRSGTEHRIDILGAGTCEVTIDNIYSYYQYGIENINYNPADRKFGGITVAPIQGNSAARDAKVTIKMIGDNRVGAVHYSNNAKNGNELIFEGTGSLTVADVDGRTVNGTTNPNNGIGIESGVGYWGNHWSSAIGGRDSGDEQKSFGIVINSGTIFAGTTKAENCTAIGGGGNDYGTVTINGGTVTAVATTTGTAIGGGIGYGSPGGKGEVTITGGNVYAYNLANRWGIPSSAIGGAGSRTNYGEKGIVKISGGYVYAESALGTAIGGGSSSTKQGGDAEIEITGGEVIARTASEISASIGGGTGFVNDGNIGNPDSGTYNGGSATITISGDPIIRTGSIGGGGTGDTGGKNPGHLGNATIHVSGGDISAQFILAAGSGKTPTFKMDGGTIRNSDTLDEVYKHVKENGGAIYLENGTVEISGGRILNCSAEWGGAIYIEGTTGKPSSASFKMTGGQIKDNEVAEDGGAIYILDGTVELLGGTIENNLATIGNGGGVFIRRGNLTVDGAKILNNSAEAASSGGNGGGIYVYSYLEDVNVNLISGEIIGNTADRLGGGVCVDLQNSDKVAEVVIGEAGGNKDGIRITDNLALLRGGGLYARGKNAHITINSGTILGNTVSQYVHNQNVANEGGTVTLNNDDVTTSNVVSFYKNDGTSAAGDPPYSTQYIVTSTNSFLVTPTVSRTGYDFTGWNTKPNGTGETYTDGQTMNINTDISLYAQWKIAVQP